MINFDDYTFLYNADAYFKAQEKFPDGFITILLKQDKEAFDALVWFLAEMSLQGELVRRYMGEEKKDFLTEEKVRHLMTVKEMPEALKVVVSTIQKGLEIETDENEEIDEVLAELQKKTETPA